MIRVNNFVFFRCLSVVVVFQFLLKQIWNFRFKKIQNKCLSVTPSTKLCSEHFEDNDFEFVDDSRVMNIRKKTLPPN